MSYDTELYHMTTSPLNANYLYQFDFHVTNLLELHTSFCHFFLMEVDPVGGNQCRKLFYPSSIFLMDDNVAIIFLSSRKTRVALKIRPPPWPQSFWCSTSFHSNQLHHLRHYSCTLWHHSPRHPLPYFHFLHIFYVFLASSTSILDFMGEKTSQLCECSWSRAMPLPHSP